MGMAGVRSRDSIPHPDMVSGCLHGPPCWITCSVCVCDREDGNCLYLPPWKVGETVESILKCTGRSAPYLKKINRGLSAIWLLFFVLGEAFIIHSTCMVAEMF